MSERTYHYAPGGLLRCTIIAIHERMQRASMDETWPELGEVLTCPHCQQQAIYADYNGELAWQWKDKGIKPEPLT